ncbi:6-phosphogluconolactonase [Oceanitalea stevensii]|uniref:6-phosphogluconolactonase n=1 Tax=Oceanitalea stevensii TaxID=2763072 RepID=A0ABR8YZ35_9MICO|nr:6-phosphogluconolactonase [Oceanitalea stevensii]MBD8061305.1 6-phosphogluconolactonase [Oceanitalea stevensii]
MSTQAPVVVHPDGELLARATAARFLLALVDAQSVATPVHVALTGGSILVDVLRAVAADPLRDAVDWTAVHVWWGDERFVPAGHEERNDVDAAEALLDHLPLRPEHVHAVPGPDRVADVDAAARAYTEELAAHAAPGAEVPELAVVLLGMGPDGHVASLFPGRPSLGDESLGALAEAESPKPPPERVSLTLPTLCSAHQVWLVVSGEGKAPAVAAALAQTSLPEAEGGTGDGQSVPAGRVRASGRTLWLVDLAATSALP